MDRIDAVVVGGGVVGLAVGRALAMSGRETVILERHSLIGSEASSRNSEVIHAGIYYPQGSLKAQTCVAGRTLLYDYCKSHNVPHRQIGKLIVATNSEQLRELSRIRTAAATNGVDDLIELDGDAARKLEPALRCVGALLSPSTGIIDSHAYMLALLGDAETHGAVIAYNADVVKISQVTDGLAITLADSLEPVLSTPLLVNAAGLHAPCVAARVEGIEQRGLPTAHYAKGVYFALEGRVPFSRLVYPVPEAGGLGTHLTIDMAGQARFGPDVEWVDKIDYAVNPQRAKIFAQSIREYWPELPAERLVPAYAGIRAKLNGPEGPAEDFRIDGPARHGVPGLINLFGIESPGLTASMALADHVLRVAEGIGHA